MSEPTIFVELGHAGAMLWHNDPYRRSVSKCATCGGKRQTHVFDRHSGFCADCLERSRTLDRDDIGGES